MAMINIDRKNPDPFHRYKMPKLIVRVERNGNSFKTVLLNLSAVARALDRPPIYLSRYFGIELSASIKMNATNGICVIKGVYNQEILQDLLDGFIKKYVLCRYCDNPETELSVHKKNGNKICQRCYACGNTIGIEFDRLATFISNYIQQNENEIGYNLQEIIPIGGEGIMNQGTDDYDDENEDWGDDLPSPDAESDKDTQNIIHSKDSDDQRHEHYEQFISLLNKKKLNNQLNDPLSIQELIIEAEQLEMFEKALFFVAECLFTDQIIKEIELYKLLLQKLCALNIKGQMYLLYGLEKLIDTNNEIRTKLLNTKGMSKILLKLYEEDIVVEEVFYEWHEKVSKQFVDKTMAEEIRECAKQFIQWLRTAEESSDEEIDKNSDLQ